MKGSPPAVCLCKSQAAHGAEWNWELLRELHDLCKHRQRKVLEKTNSSPTHLTMLRLMVYMQSVTSTNISTSKQPTGHTMDVTENLFYKCVLNISHIYVSVIYKHLDSLVCTKVTLTRGVSSQPFHSRLQLSVCLSQTGNYNRNLLSASKWTHLWLAVPGGELSRLWASRGCESRTNSLDTTAAVRRWRAEDCQVSDDH